MGLIRGDNHHRGRPFDPMQRNLRYHSLRVALLFSLSASTLWAREIQNRGARQDPGEQVLNVSPQLPEATLANLPVGDVSLLPGLFRERRELTKAYLLRLKTENILQNYLLEAGVRIDTPYEQMHQGWEAPYCQLRGHFAGHWLSAAAHFAAVDHDAFAAERAGEVVQGLKRCQELNGGQWVGSIPEKYFAILADGREWVWSPQYTLHKTMMGLFDAYRYTGNKEALTVLEHSAGWFSTWTEKLVREGHGDVVYNGECAGMLELWSDLYGATKDPRYLKLAARYSTPDLFRELLAGHDPLTNDHANASIPWIQGAARLYEVTGDARYREIVTSFWKQAVEDRGMFATTGNNAGEFWIPPQQFDRFLGSRTQEHCTVYNMIRVAQYLFRWTGEARYADYIERALYNGILAQQNPDTGLVCYFLPLQPGAKKVWGSETHDFWCCHGTLVQAQAMFEDLIYYQARDGVTVSQFISSQATLGNAGHQIRIMQKTDASGDRSNFARTDDTTQFVIDLTVASDEAGPWTLRIRQPGWAIGPAVVTVDGESVQASVSKNGFLEINRKWTNAHVKVVLSKRVTQEPLPGDSQRFALIDGPVVLAALTDKEPELLAKDSITPQYEHQYVEGRDWQSGHFLVRTRQGTLTVQPLYEIADANYCVYFAATR
jgi:uncharacterized protein